MSIANISLSGYAAGDAYYNDQIDSKDGSGRKLKLATFKIAHNPRSSNKEKPEEAVFIRVSAWGIQADIARDRISKGTFVSVTGPLTSCRVAVKDGKEVKDQSGNSIVNMEMTARDLEVPRMGEAPAGGYKPREDSWSGESNMAHEAARELVTEGMQPPF